MAEQPRPRAIGDTDSDLKEGDVVGEYVVSSKVGSGGFGTVFSAQHPLIGKKVAIKVLRRKYSADPEYVDRFVAEARSVNQIRHRNIIDIFAFGQLPDGRHYFVMEFLEGRTLEQHRAALGHLPVGEAIALLRGLAQALDAAHRQGIAHRDLKPENVFLLEQEGQPLFLKLLDFGIAKLLDDGDAKTWTQTGSPLGTPVYMSPEQARGRKVDHRTDIYSFGVMIYELVTGALPFVGQDYIEILNAHIKAIPDAPSARLAGLPEELDAPILWMLEKEADKRPESLGTALKALEVAATDAGLHVPDAPPQSGVLAVGTAPVERELAVASTRMAFERAPATEPDLPAAAEGTRKRKRMGWALGAGVIAAALGVAGFVLTRGEEPVAGNDGSAQPARAASTDATTTRPDDALAVPTSAKRAAPTITIEILGAPEGSSVHGPSGVFFGSAPGRIQVLRSDEPLILQIRAPGHRAESQELIPSKDRRLSVTLKELVAAPPTKPVRDQRGGVPPAAPENSRGSLEDPF